MHKLYFLGRPYVEIDGTEVALSRRKNIALLAYLALVAEPRRRAELIALLWPELDTYHAQTALRRDLWVLKQTLDNRGLIVSHDSVGLAATDIWCDVTAFQQLLATHRAQHDDAQQPPDECIERLATAVQLYRDDFLRGFSLRDSPPFDEWHLVQTEALRHDLSVALETLIRAYTQQDNLDLAITYAQRLLELDPLHEPAHYQLMQLYGKAGRYAAARKQFQRCKQLLAEQLGVEPAADTVRLQAELYANSALHFGVQSIRTDSHGYQENRELPKRITGRVPAAERHDADSTAIAPPAEPHNLPDVHVAFVGRTRELAEVAQLLATPECRLLTLTGPGGIGKTRLAIEVAHQQLPNFADGVYFVKLAGLRHVELLAAAMLEAVGLRRSTEQSPEESLCAYLRPRQVLLILDNFEHLRAGIPLLERILTKTAHLQFLITSRERLNIQTEWIMPLPGLRYATAPGQEAAESAPDEPRADAPSDAAQFFAECARRVQPTLTLTTADNAAIDEICQLVEGIPLAIELAATWLPIMSCTAIARELHKGLDILHTSQAGLPERHRSMRATLEASWRLATAEEQRLLCQLAVFHDGFLPAAAQAVAAANPPRLLTLADKSWLQRAANGRLTMHELVRQFCAEKLATGTLEPQQVHAQHSRYYATFMRDLLPDLHSGQQVAAVDAIVAEVDNVRAAWAWATETAAIDLLNHFVESFYLVGRIRNWHREMIDLFAQTATQLAAPRGESMTTNQQPSQPSCQYLLARLWNRMACYLIDLGRLDEAEVYSQQSIKRLTSSASCAPSIVDVNTEMGAEWRHEARFARSIQSVAFVQQGRYQEAIASAESALDELSNTDDSETTVNATLATAQARFATGEQPMAIARLTRMATNLRRVGELWLRSRLLVELVFFLRIKNEFALARRYTAERLDLCRTLGDSHGIASALEDHAYILLFSGQVAAALPYLTEVLTIGTELQHPILRCDALFGLGHVAYFQQEWDQSRRYFEESYAIAVDAQNAGRVTLNYLWLGELALVQGALDTARTYFDNVLQQAVSAGRIPVILLGLEGMAKAHLHSDEMALALATLAFIQAHPNTWEFARERVKIMLTELQAEVPGDEFAAAVAEGRTVDWAEVVAWWR